MKIRDNYHPCKFCILKVMCNNKKSWDTIHDCKLLNTYLYGMFTTCKKLSNARKLHMKRWDKTASIFKEFEIYDI
jgi:hypothetical protein